MYKTSIYKKFGRKDRENTLVIEWVLCYITAVPQGNLITALGVQLSWLERNTDNVEVPGSNPGTPTTVVRSHPLQMPRQLSGRAED